MYRCEESWWKYSDKNGWIFKTFREAGSKKWYIRDTLTRKESKAFRKYNGKITWLASNTRPFRLCDDLHQKTDEGHIKGFEGDQYNLKEGWREINKVFLGK